MAAETLVQLVIRIGDEVRDLHPDEFYAAMRVQVMEPGCDPIGARVRFRSPEIKRGSVPVVINDTDERIEVPPAKLALRYEDALDVLRLGGADYDIVYVETGRFASWSL